jgi:hypothetical protein
MPFYTAATEESMEDIVFLRVQHADGILSGPGFTKLDNITNYRCG